MLLNSNSNIVNLTSICPKIDDKLEAILTTIAQSKPPAGRKRWTLQILADRLVTLTHLESISYEAVRLILKKQVETVGPAKMVYSDRDWG